MIIGSYTVLRFCGYFVHVCMLGQSETDMLKPGVDSAERQLQSKRQEKISLQHGHQAFMDELEVLKIESNALEIAMQRAKIAQKVAEGTLDDKLKQMNQFRFRCDDIRKRLEAESITTISRERTIKDVEVRLEKREQEYKQVLNSVRSLKNQLFKDSQKLGSLRQSEADMIADIQSTQVYDSCDVSSLNLAIYDHSHHICCCCIPATVVPVIRPLEKIVQ